MINPYTENNLKSRQAVLDFAGSLSRDELECTMPADWTVSGVLMHLAFWDLRAYTLLTQWMKSGIGPSPVDTDLVNESMRVICCTVQPPDAVSVFRESAMKIDNLIDSLDPDFLHKVETQGKTVHLDRAEHRHCHLEEIRQVLQAG